MNLLLGKSKAKGLKVVFASMVLAFTFVTPSNASNVAAGYISDIMITPGGVVLFNVTGTRTALAACQSPAIPTRWAFDGATPAGQVKMATLLSALSLQRQVTITGTGTCPDWGDTESFTYIMMRNG